MNVAWNLKRAGKDAGARHASRRSALNELAELEKLLDLLPQLTDLERQLLEALLTVSRLRLAAASTEKQAVAAIPNAWRLSERELEVLQLIVAGKTSAEAGQVLGLSSRTVEVHRTNLKQKMGANSTSTLVRMAMEAAERRDQIEAERAVEVIATDLRSALLDVLGRDPKIGGRPAASPHQPYLAQNAGRS